MFNKKIKLYIILVIIFFSWFHITFASFEITEIMYNLDGTDTNREWIEVHNTGTDNADLSKWYFFSDNTKHALVPEGSSEVSSDGYAVIAQDVSKFKIDWPNYTGLLFDSSWIGLNNDGETIALKDPDLNVVSSVDFSSSQGAAGDGNSLQLVNNSWTAATPTPGTQNVDTNNTQSAIISSGGGGGGTEATSQVSKPVVKKEVEIPRITTSILSKNTVFSGLPFKIDAYTLGLSKEVLTKGKFVWNFGDGMTKTLAEQKSFDYSYDYPGQYTITLSYYNNYYSTTPDATDRMIIKVIPSEIYISSVGNGSEPYIELSNDSQYEMDLSNWVIKGFIHSFYIPVGTIMLPKNKLKFPSRVTGFTNEDLRLVTLESSNKEIFSVYPNIITKSVAEDASAQKEFNPSVPVSNIKPNIPISTTSNAIDLNNLGASAGTVDKNSKSFNNIFAILGLVFVVLIGVVSTILFRKKNITSDDLDKNIKASDMTILE